METRNQTGTMVAMVASEGCLGFSYFVYILHLHFETHAVMVFLAQTIISHAALLQIATWMCYSRNKSYITTARIRSQRRTFARMYGITTHVDA